KDENISQIYTSPLGRSVETAGCVSKALGLPVQTLDFMEEIYWAMGDSPLYKNGHPWMIADEMAAHGINLNRPDWRETEDFKTNRVLECVDRIESDIDKWLESLGYKREGFYYRHTEEEKEHRTIALFSHGGSSSVAIGHIINLPFPYVCGLFHTDYTGITILRFEKKKGLAGLPCLELANDARHAMSTLK
ncbi:MAG: histidine phosphatase family protein, partial [Lachnospiraceae bacterium]|nr:histidine phosphatase family protein [Lachnospiraceae bacterium]